jgi:hypothetical protein
VYLPELAEVEIAHVQEYQSEVLGASPAADVEPTQWFPDQEGPFT